MTSVRVVLTYRDYAALPDDGRRYEIHDGELSVTPAPGRTHQYVLLRLAAALHAHVSAHDLGEIYIAPFDVILADTTIIQPDITFVAKDRLAILSERGADGAPTLVVEMLSRSTTHVDRTTKLQLYARHAVPYYWIVDPERHWSRPTASPLARTTCPNAPAGTSSPVYRPSRHCGWTRRRSGSGEIAARATS
jgi:Uma2 family endonuclease